MSGNPVEERGEAGGGNLFAAIPAAMPAELCQALLRAGPVRIERIISRGQASPDGFWCDQDQAEWVVVLQGRARIRLASETSDREMGPGDYLLLPPLCRHRVTWTDPDSTTVWLAVFVDAGPHPGKLQY